MGRSCFNVCFNEIDEVRMSLNAAVGRYNFVCLEVFFDFIDSPFFFVYQKFHICFSAYAAVTS